MNLKDSTKKWKLVYHGGDTFYLSQKEYEYFTSKIFSNGPDVLVNMSGEGGSATDSPLLSGRFQTLIQNPEWVDPVEAKRKEIFYKLRRDYLERRENGDKITWAEYIQDHKEEAQEMMSKFKEELSDD